MLEVYQEARAGLNAFMNANADVFNEHKRLATELANIEEQLKAAVRAAGHGAETDMLAIRYTPRRSVSYNFTKMAEVATPKEIKLIESVSIVSVDKAELTKLVQNGLVRVEVERAGFEEKELTPAIMIKEKSNADQA